MCLARKDYQNLINRAKALTSRFDNPLIVAYSEELDDLELIKLILESLQYDFFLFTETSFTFLFLEVLPII